MFHMYCVDDKDKEILLKNDWSFIEGLKEDTYTIQIEVNRCTNKTSNSRNITCSSPEEIEKWTLTKQLHIRLLDYTID